MRRKLISAILCVTMVATAFVGCGNKEADPSSAETTTGAGAADSSAEAGGDTSGEGITLKWSVWDQKTTPYWDLLAQGFMEKNPDIKVELVDLGSQDYATVLGTDLSGGGADFDMVTIKDVPGYATLVSKGVLEPLSENIEKDGVDLTQYSGTTEQVMVENELYQLPFRMDFWLMYYNKDIFDKAGVDYPTNDMTIEEYDKLVRSVSGDGIYGAHYHPWRSAVQLFGILDGKHTILDGEYEFTKPYYEMVLKQQEDKVTRSYMDVNASQLHYSAAFSEGNTATMNMGSWFIGTLATSLASGEYDAAKCGNWGVTAYPHPADTEAGSTLGTITGIAIPTSSKNKEAAWEFVKFVSGEEGAKILAESGNFPAAMNDEVIDIITSIEGFPQDEASKAALKPSNIYLEAPYAENVSEINNTLDVYHKDIMNGDITVEEGLEFMRDEVAAVQ